MRLETINNILISATFIFFLVGCGENKSILFKEFENICYMEFGMKKDIKSKHLCQCIANEKIKVIPKDLLPDVLLEMESSNDNKVKFMSKKLYDEIRLKQNQSDKCLMEMGL